MRTTEITKLQITLLRKTRTFFFKINLLSCEARMIDFTFSREARRILFYFFARSAEFFFTFLCEARGTFYFFARSAEKMFFHFLARSAEKIFTFLLNELGQACCLKNIVSYTTSVGSAALVARKIWNRSRLSYYFCGWFLPLRFARNISYFKGLVYVLKGWVPRALRGHCPHHYCIRGATGHLTPLELQPRWQPQLKKFKCVITDFQRVIFRNPKNRNAEQLWTHVCLSTKTLFLCKLCQNIS